MQRNTLYTALISGVALVACSSGDINIQPSTNVTDSNNTITTGGGGGSNDVCASYVEGGQTLQGVYDGNNCTYSAAFASAGNNVDVDLVFQDLPGGGAHIFEGSLFIGETYRTNADLAAAGIAAGGDGPTLTIEAGATLAWQTNADFLVINGFAVTNKCAYTGTRGVDLAVDGECHVDAEGSLGLDESQYGGDNDADSSGRMEYLVVKHTGATVGNGDELNGVSFGGVGSNTIVKNLEAYSTFDDGIELFGGAVNIENYVAVYVRDDSIDIDEGYSGTITNALVIQSEDDGQQCIESDGIGDFSNFTATEVDAKIAQGLNSRPTINNLTCIISANGAATATHEPGAGWRFREGIFPTINNALVISSFGANDTANATDNSCLRIDNRSQQAAVDGDLHLNSVVFACQENHHAQAIGAFADEQAFAESEGNVFATVADGTIKSATTVNDADLQLLEGSPPIYSIDYATSQVDGAAPGAGSTPTSGTYLGALSLGAPDWTANWTYGIHRNNRAQALWFETL